MYNSPKHSDVDLIDPLSLPSSRNLKWHEQDLGGDIKPNLARKRWKFYIRMLRKHLKIVAVPLDSVTDLAFSVVVVRKEKRYSDIG